MKQWTGVLLAGSLMLGVLSGCTGGERQESDGSAPSGSIQEPELSGSSWEEGSFLPGIGEVQTDFTDTLGFRVETCIGLPIRETGILEDKAAYFEFELDRTTFIGITVMETALAGAWREDDQLVYESRQVVEISGLSVDVSYSMGGPMRADWSKDGYSYLLSVKKGEGDMSEDDFIAMVRHFAEDFVALPASGR